MDDNKRLSAIEINLKEDLKEGEITFKMRNMGRTSKFRLFDPHQ